MATDPKLAPPKIGDHVHSTQQEGIFEVVYVNSLMQNGRRLAAPSSPWHRLPRSRRDLVSQRARKRAQTQGSARMPHQHPPRKARDFGEVLLNSPIALRTSPRCCLSP